MKDYHHALETLMFEPTKGYSQERKCNHLAASGNPDIFNFYLYLRKHPLLKRRRYMSDDKKKTSTRKVVPRQGTIREEEIIDGPLSPMERQLFFKTAHAHFNSGCPGLALQVLMELPAGDMCERNTGRPCESESAVQHSSGVIEDATDNMINTGTLSDFSFGSTYTKTRINETAEEFDWSKPVSSNVHGYFDRSKPISSKLNGSSSRDYDWSLPVSSTLGGDSFGDFDWSQPLVSDHDGGASGGFDWSKPVSAKLGGSGPENQSDSFDWSQPVSAKLGGAGLDGINGLDFDESSSPSFSNPGVDTDSKRAPGNRENVIEVGKGGDAQVTALKSKETRHLDVVAQQMKFSAILKLLINELHGLPFSCAIADEDLRPYFLKWLEKELEILHKMSDYGSVADESDDEDGDTVEVKIEQGSRSLEALCSSPNERKLSLLPMI